LGVVWGNDEIVLQGEWLRDAIRSGARTAQKFLIDCLHQVDFFIALLDVPIVFDTDENNSAFFVDEPVCIGCEGDFLMRAIRVRAKATLTEDL
jgi:hypothetical protein